MPLPDVLALLERQKARSDRVAAFYDVSVIEEARREVISAKEQMIRMEG